ncbi:MAG: hypothetical protein MI919_06085 [Holophagales bacterium]|nr:hypothetical protein [Holophagales bacterium]
MTHPTTLPRAFAAVLALLGLALLFALPSTLTVEAADCGGWAGGMEDAWLETPAAQAKTANGDCGPDAICQEWCLITCGVPEPQDRFRCVPAP